MFLKLQQKFYTFKQAYMKEKIDEKKNVTHI